MAVGLIVIALSIYFVGRNLVTWYHQLAQSAITIRYGYLALAISLTMLCTLLGGWEWVLAVRALGYPLNTAAGIRIHVGANLAKYAPGYAWQLLGKAYLSNKGGVPTATTGASMFFELAAILGTGVLLAGLWLPLTPFLRYAPLKGWRGVTLAIAVTALVFAALPRLLSYIERVLTARKRWPLQLQVDWRHLTHTVLFIYLTWVLLGVGFCLIAAAVHPVDLAAIPTLMMALSVSFIISLVVFVVPGGIGVRESVLILLLSATMPAPSAAAIAVLARMALILAEVLAFAVATRL